VVDIATGDDGGMGLEGQDPTVQIMQSLGSTRNALLSLAAQLPPLAPGIQQFVQGLEMAVPQLMADLMAGQTPGMGMPGGGGAISSQAPTAPPTMSAP